MKVASCTLSNGMKVVTVGLPWAKSIAVGLWFKVGTAHENEDELGIAHFTEHLLFKGTKKHTGRRIAQVVDELGAYLEAFTEKEMTCYYARVLPEGLSKILSLMAELVTEPAINPKEVKVEQEVVLSEITEVNDTPEELVQELLLEALWDAHPLARPVLGKPETVKSFTTKSVRSFMKRFYAPDNAVVTASGCLEHERFVDELQKAFKAFNGKAMRVKLKPPKPKPNLKAVMRDIGQAYVCVGSHGFSQRERKQFICMVLLDLMLGGNASSRLFQSIREKLGLTYSIGTMSVGMKNAGFLAISFNCASKNVKRAAEELNKEINKLLKYGVGEKELERAKRQLRSSMLMSLESVTGLMLQAGRQLIYFDRLLAMEDLLSQVNSVAVDDVMAIANELFTRDRMAVSIVGPLEERNAEAIADILTTVS